MSASMSGLRLYIDAPLAEGEAAPLTHAQAHYLSGVMRRGPGDALRVFDGRTGEYDATIAEVGKRGGVLSLGARTAPLRVPPDLDLVFAPIKAARTAFIVEKAAELGARRVRPVRTARTQSERFKAERMRAHAVEAAEQCGGTYVPEVEELAPLARVLDGWEEGRALVFCDEVRAGPAAGWDAVPPGPAGIVIGPEGGFDDAERARLSRTGHPVSLGPRVLRADTAAVAALTLWQSRFGDWS